MPSASTISGPTSAVLAAGSVRRPVCRRPFPPLCRSVIRQHTARYPTRATASTGVAGQLGQFSDEGGVEQAELRVRAGDCRQLVIGTPSVL